MRVRRFAARSARRAPYSVFDSSRGWVVLKFGGTSVSSAANWHNILGVLRERIATNIGIAGDQELTNLAFNENIVVTVPGNTRFYLVLQKGSSAGKAGSSAASISTQTAASTRIPSVEELRELLNCQPHLLASMGPRR